MKKNILIIFLIVVSSTASCMDRPPQKTPKTPLSANDARLLKEARIREAFERINNPDPNNPSDYIEFIEGEGLKKAEKAMDPEQIEKFKTLAREQLEKKDTILVYQCCPDSNMGILANCLLLVSVIAPIIETYFLNKPESRFVSQLPNAALVISPPLITAGLLMHQLNNKSTTNKITKTRQERHNVATMQAVLNKWSQKEQQQKA